MVIHKQDLGFTGVIGYQTFLYPTEGDIRTLFMFLVERLPKESAEAADEPMGKICCASLNWNILFKLLYTAFISGKVVQFY